jgi:hypothetical protein
MEATPTANQHRKEILIMNHPRQAREKKNVPFYQPKAKVALAGRIFDAVKPQESTKERVMEQSAPFETVTKIEAAERQLRVAIRMFFERKDMIAVHTLACAATSP